MIVLVKLTAAYIGYLLFSARCQVFANDVLLFESLSSSLQTHNVYQTLIFLSVGSFPVVKFCP